MQDDLVIFNSSTIIFNSATSSTDRTEQRVVQVGKISETYIADKLVAKNDFVLA